MRVSTLSKSKRLSHSDQFSSVIKRGKRQRYPGFSLFYLTNNLPHARLGVSVPHRAARNAVIRNRIKRRVRESFRAEQNRFAGLDLVVIPNDDKRETNFFETISLGNKNEKN